MLRYCVHDRNDKINLNVRFIFSEKGAQGAAGSYISQGITFFNIFNEITMSIFECLPDFKNFL